ncbi:MAG TPA: hypothetical protein VFE84_06805 [Patescibacteria group bacterium]|jgi:hypothetical protein|nr:hypothetical protein [Patescibacteria group bacterium]
MKKIVFVFLVLLALFAAFVVLAGSIRQLLLGESGRKTAEISAHSADRLSS